MDQQSIATKLTEFLEWRFPNDGVELAPDTHLLEDWFVDSLGIVETVIFIEDEFGVTVSRADINGEIFRDVASLSAFVASRLNA